MNFVPENDLTLRLYELLLKKPFQNKRELLGKLEDEGWTGFTTRDINKELYRHTFLFDHGGESLPVWFAKPVDNETLNLILLPENRTELPVYYIGPEPRAWQTEALESQGNDRYS